MERDLTSSVEPKIALKLQTISTSTTTVGEIIDSQGFESVDFSFITGTLTDGDYQVALEDGEESNLSDAATVSSDFIIGTLPNFVDDTDDDVIGHFGYNGKKRFIRMSIVSTNVSSGAVVGGQATEGHAINRPTS